MLVPIFGQKKIHNLKQYPLVFTLVSPDRGSRQFCSPLDLLIHATEPKTHSRFEFSHFLSVPHQLAPLKNSCGSRPPIRHDTRKSREKSITPIRSTLNLCRIIYSSSGPPLSPAARINVVLSSSMQLVGCFIPCFIGRFGGPFDNVSFNLPVICSAARPSGC